MIIKQHLIITNPIEFSKGNYHSCFGLFGDKAIPEDWIYCSPIEIKVDVDMKECMDISLHALSEEKEQVQTEYNIKMALIEQKEAELLCLTHEKLVCPELEGCEKSGGGYEYPCRACEKQFEVAEEEYRDFDPEMHYCGGSSGCCL